MGIVCHVSRVCVVGYYNTNELQNAFRCRSSSKTKPHHPFDAVEKSIKIPRTENKTKQNKNTILRPFCGFSPSQARMHCPLLNPGYVLCFCFNAV